MAGASVSIPTPIVLDAPAAVAGEEEGLLGWLAKVTDLLPWASGGSSLEDGPNQGGKGGEEGEMGGLLGWFSKGEAGEGRGPLGQTNERSAEAKLQRGGTCHARAVQMRSHKVLERHQKEKPQSARKASIAQGNPSRKQSLSPSQAVKV